MYLLSTTIDVKETTFLLIGGLGIFLFGISFMGDALKLIAGDRMKDFIEKYTSNPFKGVLVGILTTALIQSSSGTTALTIGLVRAGLMNLNQAIGIIMGANIGTTVTAFLIGLKISDYSLPILAIGGLIYMFTNNKKVKYYGQAIFGFGALFYGLALMSDAMKPLAQLDVFKDLMISLSNNPVLGIIVGTLFTFVIQSSSAAIGILQSLYGQGAILLSGALPILFGTNIGTTITAILASIGGSVTAKRASAAHVFFNVSGTVVFTLLLIPFTKLIDYIGTYFGLNPESQLAVAHGIFNIVMTILLLPFVGLIAKSVKLIIRSKEEDEHDYDEELLNDGLIKQSSTLAITQAKNATIHTGKLVVKGLNDLEKYISTKDKKYLDSALHIETIIDSLDVKIKEYLVKITSEDLTKHETRDIQVLMQTIKDFERMGDHLENLAQLFEQIFDANEVLSEDAHKDIMRLYNITLETVILCIDALDKEDKVLSGIIIEKENNIDVLEKKARQRHIYRVSEQKCTGFISAVYVDLLNNIERIADHASNIAEYIINQEKNTTIDYQYLGTLFEELDRRK